MKSLKWNVCALAMLASMPLFTACSDDDNDGNSNGNENEIVNGSTLSGNITSDVTLAAGNSYKLSGAYTVKSGATLNIEAGVTITAVDDDVVDYILVEQGGKINAVGTASNPIIMTSENQEPGAWGGIHLCGYAQVNVEGGTGTSEIGDATYGGSDDTDNSGVLQYVRVEYSGYAFNSEKEANGITFYGVGSGTTVDHCEAYKGSDDGFEFFGGAVNINYMVAVSCSDDSFDWTEGWRGTATNLVAYQEAESTLGYDCDCLIEADNNENDYTATPIAHPTLKNLIFVGNGSTENTRGIRLRRGTQVSIDNAIVCGKTNAVTLESEETENYLLSGTSTLTNMTVDTELRTQNSIYTNDMFEAAGNTVDASKAYFASFDDIVAANSWLSGNWVKGADGGNGSKETITLSGNITSDVTLTSDYLYKLSGAYTVKSGATLNIEPGVTITAIDDEIVDYILVEQGGKINAVGTADNPIIMTSENEEPGAWGGIHICGYAQVNVEGGTGTSEIGDATYGGTNDADNSGVLQYVRVEYSGYAFNSEKEANGITFYGVGNGTTVDHCEAYKGSDDGFEFFGGAVNISYMVAVSCSDDSFDWTEGWRGTGDHLVAYQEPKSTLGYDCDCLIEADNNENDYTATPISHPTLSNLIFVGNDSEENTRGIRLRRGTQASINNAIVCGKTNAVTLESEETENYLLNGTSILTNMTVDTELKTQNSIYTNAMFLAAGNTLDATLAYNSFADIVAANDWLNADWVK